MTAGRAAGRWMGTLVLVVAGLVAVALVTATGTPGPVRVAAALALAGVLPGLALVRLLLRPDADATTASVAAVGLSLAACVLVALAVHVSPWRLDRTTWARGLGAVALAAALAGAGRSERPRLALRWWPTPRPRDVALLAGAVVITVTAVAAARHPLPPPPSVTGYTQLWLTPAGHDRAELGVASFELTETTYRLELLVDGRVTATWDRILLEPRGRWTDSVGRGTGTVEARLYRGTDGGLPYRHVELRPAGAQR